MTDLSSPKILIPTTLFTGINMLGEQYPILMFVAGHFVVSKALGVPITRVEIVSALLLFVLLSPNKLFKYNLPFHVILFMLSFALLRYTFPSRF